jgi:hypothetical protein
MPEVDLTGPAPKKEVKKDVANNTTKTTPAPAPTPARKGKDDEPEDTL